MIRNDGELFWRKETLEEDVKTGPKHEQNKAQTQNAGTRLNQGTFVYCASQDCKEQEHLVKRRYIGRPRELFRKTQT